MRPDIFFSGTGIDRADAARGSPSRLADFAASDQALELVWRDGIPAIGDGGRLEWGPVIDPSLFLGLDRGAPRFSAVVDPSSQAFSVMPLLAHLDWAEAPLFAAAVSLTRWHVRNRFCANCGRETRVAKGGWSRSCSSCSAEHFPRVEPVVIMAVEHRERILLARQSHFPPRRYSALAGFVEVGESIEAAVAREIREEAGIEIGNMRYVASQPWPFPSSLMIACRAEAASSKIIVDHAELEDARWFSRDEVALSLAGSEDAPFLPPPRAAIARNLLEQWASGDQGPPAE